MENTPLSPLDKGIFPADVHADQIYMPTISRYYLLQAARFALFLFASKLAIQGWGKLGFAIGISRKYKVLDQTTGFPYSRTNILHWDVIPWIIGFYFLYQFASNAISGITNYKNKNLEIGVIALKYWLLSELLRALWAAFSANSYFLSSAYEIAGSKGWAIGVTILTNIIAIFIVFRFRHQVTHIQNNCSEKEYSLNELERHWRTAGTLAWALLTMTILRFYVQNDIHLINSFYTYPAHHLHFNMFVFTAKWYIIPLWFLYRFAGQASRFTAQQNNQVGKALFYWVLCSLIFFLGNWITSFYGMVATGGTYIPNPRSAVYFTISCCIFFFMKYWVDKNAPKPK